MRSKTSTIMLICLASIAFTVGAWADPPAARLAGGSVEALQSFWAQGYQNQTDPLSEDAAAQPVTLLAKAEPDECYRGIGVPGGTPPCEAGIPKVNEAYVWGLTKSGSRLWFGTAPNTHCLVIGGFLGGTTPSENDSWACEFGESQLSPPLPPAVGDWRAPKIYAYDLESETLSNVTPFDPRIPQSTGVRSAGALDDVVILAGPGLLGGIHLFAYDARDASYLGGTTLPQYTNIRSWTVVEGVLYTAVRNADGTGSVLRWRGSVDDPFAFETVGFLPSEGAYLAHHENRLFVSTWPNLQGEERSVAGVYMSAVIPRGGLTVADATNWSRVWSASDYEPDPIVAATYGGGALASNGKHLYWGTMHVPLLSAVAAFALYEQGEIDLDANGNGEIDVEEILRTVLGTYRPISIFRGRSFGTPNETLEPVYALPFVPVYNPLSRGYDIDLTPPYATKMGYGIRGLSGFGNLFNQYTWTMTFYEGEIYVGTFDWSYVLVESLLGSLYESLAPGVDAADVPPIPWSPLPPYRFGGDLFRIGLDGFARVESVSGVGNYSNYGIRTAITDGEALYLGTANPMNLMTDPDDDRPEGGWELLKLGE